MKKIIYALLISLVAFIKSYGQSPGIKISEMPTYNGSGDTSYVPIVINGVNRKIQGKNLASGKIDSITITGGIMYAWKNGISTQVGILNDTLRAIRPLYAPDSTSIAILTASATDTGALKNSDWIRFNHKVDSVYTHSCACGVDSILYDDGSGTGKLAFVIDVTSDGWVVAPQLLWSGTPFVYNTTAGVLRKNGKRYDIAPNTLQIDTNSTINPRIDAIYGDTTGFSRIMKGVAAPTPSKPTLDETYQKEISFLTIPAGSSPAIDTSVLVDDNNVPPNWTVTSTGSVTVDPNYTGTFFRGTKSVNVTNISNNASVVLSKGSTADLTPYAAIVGYIKLKAPMSPTGSIYLQWYNGATKTGNSPIINISKSNITGWQGFSIPIPNFSLATLSVTQLRLVYQNSNGLVYPGYYLDFSYLQNGVPAAPPTASTQTLQDVFNTETSGSKLTRPDVIIADSGNLQVTGGYAADSGVLKVRYTGVNSFSNFTPTAFFGNDGSAWGGVALFGKARGVGGVGVMGSGGGFYPGGFFYNEASIGIGVMGISGSNFISSVPSGLNLIGSHPGGYFGKNITRNDTVGNALTVIGFCETCSPTSAPGLGAAIDFYVDHYQNGSDKFLGSLHSRSQYFGGLDTVRTEFLLKGVFNKPGVAANAQDYMRILGDGTVIVNNGADTLSTKAGARSLFPATGTGTATADVTGILNGHKLTISDGARSQVIFNNDAAVPVGIDVFHNIGGRINMYTDSTNTFPSIKWYYGTPSSKTLEAYHGLHWTPTDHHFDLVDMRDSITYAAIQSNGSTIFQVMGDGRTQVGFAGTSPGFQIGNTLALPAGAIMEVKSTTKGSISAPKMTNTQRDAIASPTEGIQIYSTTDHQPQFYNGTSWGASGGGISGTADNLLKTSGTNLNTNKTFASLTYAGTTNWDLTTGYNKSLTLTGNANLAMLNAQSGDHVFLLLFQDATGSRTLTVPDQIITINSNANDTTIIQGVYNGTSWWWASSADAKITGLVTQGTGITITGSGTKAAPYVVNATATTGTYSQRLALSPSNGVEFFQTNDGRNAPAGKYYYLNGVWNHVRMTDEDFWYYFNDFTANAHTVVSLAGYLRVGVSGTGATESFTANNAMGYGLFSTGTTAGGWTRLDMSDGASSGNAGFKPSTTNMYYQITIPSISQKANLTDNYNIDAGFTSSSIGNPYSTGYYFRYDSTTSPNWLYRNGTGALTSTGVAVNTATAYTLEVFVRSDSVFYWVNNSQVAAELTGSNTTFYQPLTRIIKTLGTTAVTMNVDYVKIWARLQSTRTNYGN